MFPYHDPELETAPFPKAFPFSSMVYQVFYQLKQFVVNCTRFAAKLNLRWALLKVVFLILNSLLFEVLCITTVRLSISFFFPSIIVECANISVGVASKTLREL